ncbi:gliding motility-associated C-terminal domain-containing protein [Pedobacter sp. UC225_61]|uniref:gliding motility-associated C-terminal domain-containing protein n=1 Tax=Pedobacter sp. UC225_61 TaxID=3374623 RepID=UPI0037B99168
MIHYKKTFIYLSGLVIYLMDMPCHAQMVNNGSIVSLSTNSITVLNNTDFIHQKGELYLNGWLGLSGNWSNQDEASKVLNPSSKGTVEFLGNHQKIAGANTTAFYNLSLTGTGIKTLGVNQEVNGELDLTDRELALESYDLAVNNGSVDAVKRSSGFVSSGNTPGALVRKMNGNADYLFPTGSSKNGLLYRPVILKGQGPNQTLSVAMLAKDPEIDGLSAASMSKKNGLFDVNHKFYHKIEQLNGLDAMNIDLLFDPLTDGNFKEMAFWNGTTWLPSRANVLTGLYGDKLSKKTSKKLMDMKGLKYFALANQNSDDLFIPNTFSPNGDGKNDTWEIPGLEMYADNEVRITNRWGDEVYSRKPYTNANAWNGGGLNEGTYYYFISVNVAGSVKTYSGYLTLLH